MLYIVATPIGTLSEVTYRAVEILKSVDYIACEDTRTSKVFLSHYSINKPLVSYHKFNEVSSQEKIIADLKSGKDIALISDAGMPGISDPGTVLVNKLIECGLPYTVVSGPSACINAFVLSGFDTPFTFVGFLPDKNGDKVKALQEYKTYKSTLIFYVSPHDLVDTLNTMHNMLGNRKICVVRELTKKFEEVYFTTLADGYDSVLKGEFVVVVQGYMEENNDLLSKSVVEHIKYYTQNGFSKNEAIKLVAKERKLKKDEVYKQAIDL
ncbi:MAG: 16S rRNA (cytidine(1402)-2'-O)-methyltransferase [Clostridia bacterium]|nr:16S rRNA (cytidine(1402)-2'-O)-methyltransferase [Clostridia bacterium]